MCVGGEGEGGRERESYGEKGREGERESYGEEGREGERESAMERGGRERLNQEQWVAQECFICAIHRQKETDGHLPAQDSHYGREGAARLSLSLSLALSLHFSVSLSTLSQPHFCPPLPTVTLQCTPTLLCSVSFKSVYAYVYFSPPPCYLLCSVCHSMILPSTPSVLSLSATF